MQKLAIRSVAGIAGALLFLTGSVNSFWGPLEAQAEVRPSRLSQLIHQPARLYLPARLLIGQENRFIIQGAAGHHVRLYISPDAQGAKAPNGRTLAVGEVNQQLEGVIPEKGVLELKYALPAEESIVGQPLYVDAFLWQATDFSDVEATHWMDPTGRETDQNQLAIAKASNGKGSMFLPSMPGMPSQVFQQLSNFSNLQKGDARKKELIDQGALERDTLIEQNTFINRPGQKNY